ncbi:MAG: hypothetical protein IT385_08110 [Deltaproteobacteria bacterium]|nr:hypothetical protein [Deltaproteobacteria bacterium]
MSGPTIREPQRAPTPKPVPEPPSKVPGGRAKEVVGKIAGFDGQAAALDPAAGDALTRFAQALAKAKTETERRSIVVAAEAKGVRPDELAKKALELAPAKVAAPSKGGAAEKDTKEAGAADKPKDTGGTPAALAALAEEKDPAKLQSGLEAALVAAKTPVARQAVHDLARARGIRLVGSKTEDDDGNTQGLLLAGRAGVVGVDGDGVRVGVDGARRTVDDGKRTTDVQLGVQGGIDKQGEVKVDAGGRVTRDGPDGKQSTYIGGGYDTKAKELAVVAGRDTDKTEGGAKTTTNTAHRVALGDDVSWTGAHKTKVERDTPQTRSDKAQAKKLADQKHARELRAWDEQVKKAVADGKEPPDKPDAPDHEPPKDAIERSGTGSVRYGENGLEVGAGGERATTKSDPQGQGSVTKTLGGNVGLSKDGLDLGGKSTTSTTNPGGTVTSKERSGSLQLGPDGGVVVKGGTAKTVKTLDGKSVTSNVGGGFDAKEQAFTVNAGKTTTNKDGTKQGVTGNATIDLGERGLEGVSGNVGVTHGKVTIDVGGAYKFVIDEPVTVDGKFVVTYTKVVSGNVKGGGGPISGGLSGGETSKGVRHFKTAAEAEAFRKKGPEQAEAPKTADDAKRMQVGDKTTTSTDAGADLGAKGNLQGVRVGAKLKVGTSRTVTVLKVDADRVHVEVTDADTLGGEASLGTFGVGLSVGGSRTLTQGVVLEFDLSKAEGRLAFEAFRKGGVAPQDAKVVARTKGRTDVETAGLNIGILDVTSTSTVEESTTVTGSGDKVEHAAGTDGFGVDAGFLGKHAVTTKLDTYETNDKQRSYATRTNIDSTSGQAAGKELAEATGTKWSTVDGAPKGQWSVTSHFTDAQIAKLCEQIKSNRFNHHALIHEAGDGKALIDAVKGAGGDMDRVRRALSEFVSETGSEGLALMRKTIGGKFSYDLELSGDAHFKGAAGRAATEGAIASFKARLAKPGADASALLGEIAKVLAEQQERLSAIGDPKRYPELPPELRSQEIGKARALVRSLEALRDQAIAKVTGPALSKADDDKKTPGKEAGADKDKPGTTPAHVAPDKKGPESPSQALAREWALVVAAEQRLKATADEAARERGKARKSRWVHLHGAYATQKSAFKAFGDELGGTYAEADGIYRSATGWWESAETHARALEAKKAAAAQGMAANPQAWVGKLASGIVGQIDGLRATYGVAREGFASAERYYQGLRMAIVIKNPNFQDSYFRGYGFAMPEGANVP